MSRRRYRRGRRGWSFGRIVLAGAAWRIGEILAIPILVCGIMLILFGLGMVSALIAWLGTIVAPEARLSVGLAALTLIVVVAALYRALVNSGWWGAHRHHVVAASLLVLAVGILVGSSYPLLNSGG